MCEGRPSGVQADWSAFAIHLRFMGVSSVTGRMAAARQSSASPDPAHARLLVRWCTAAWRGVT